MAISTGIALALAPQLFQLLLRPAPGIQPIFIDLTEMMATYFRVALLGGFVLGLPVVLYELVMFIAPGLTPREKRYLYVVLPMASLLFAAGVLFCYFILLPPSLRFLLTFGSDIAQPQIRIGNYVGVVTRLLFWSGLIFETPLVMVFFAKIRIVSPQTYARGRRWAIVLAFVLGAIITPTFDPVNQTLLALPIIILYEMGIWLSRLVAPKGREA